MDCPNGCSLAGAPQRMHEPKPGHYACPQCRHEEKPSDPEFSCDCPSCETTGLIDATKPSDITEKPKAYRER